MSEPSYWPRSRPCQLRITLTAGPGSPVACRSTKWRPSGAAAHCRRLSISETKWTCGGRSRFGAPTRTLSPVIVSSAEYRTVVVRSSGAGPCQNSSRPSPRHCGIAPGTAETRVGAAGSEKRADVDVMLARVVRLIGDPAPVRRHAAVHFESWRHQRRNGLAARAWEAPGRCNRFRERPIGRARIGRRLTIPLAARQ